MRISDWSSDVCSSDLRGDDTGGMRAGDSGYHGPDQGGRASDRQSSADARDRMAEPPGETPRHQAAPVVPARRSPRAARRLAAVPRTRPQAGNALGEEAAHVADRTSVAWGKGVAARVQLRVGRIIKKKKQK